MYPLEAKNRYHNAALAMGLNFSEEPKLQATFEAVSGFQAALRRLERYATGAQSAQLNQLITDLERQVKTIEQIRRRELATARQTAAGLGRSLTSSLEQLGSMCKNV